MRQPNRRYTGIDGPNSPTTHRTKDSPAFQTNHADREPHPEPGRSVISVNGKRRNRSHSRETSHQEPDVLAPSAKKSKLDSDCKTEDGKPRRRSTSSRADLNSSRDSPSTTVNAPENAGLIQGHPVPFDADYGNLQSMVDESKAIALRMNANGRERQFLEVGHDKKRCDVQVSGLGVGRIHCLLVLELVDNDQGPVVRRVLVIQLNAASVQTTIKVRGTTLQLGKKPLVLHPGSLIRFGRGPWFQYHGPQFRNLYQEHHALYGGQRANSSVSRIHRLHDGFVFVVKTIGGAQSGMAKSEVAAFKILGHHPNILRSAETFYNKDADIYHLVLEQAHADLNAFVHQTRQSGLIDLRTVAPAWVKSIAAGVGHVHACGMAHRDLKPQNILVFVTGPGRVSLKVADFGLARLNTERVIKGWRAGTKGWMAPASFMKYYDDRFTDCYGVGRILYFM
ncbi:hypothetical protein M407DRAFT_7250 [Tulasnella calospora MUT 4182]|uniref:Protein kinase domain-containing protein n=1 Tax=Tulasnella calospora MUT 4182 TaxID=1051891 RepID=A0A0C3QAT7_9AGAM|nr:hypothetical protein M407DRAFT_7250 [Tulasnella calospora MUT 4182]